MTTRFSLDGKKVSLLGYGSMRLPTVDGGHANPWAPNMSNAAIDQKRVNRQVKRMLELGINYFDTAPESPRLSRRISQGRSSDRRGPHG